MKKFFDFRGSPLWMWVREVVRCILLHSSSIAWEEHKPVIIPVRRLCSQCASAQSQTQTYSRGCFESL